MNRLLQAFARVSRSPQALLVAGLLTFFVTEPATHAADTYWISGTATPLSWSGTGNWSNGVPDATTNALTTSNGANILLGTGAQAKTLFVDGPSGGESALGGGDLTLADQLWINVTTAGTILRLYDDGSSPVSVTANNVTLGADYGKQGNIILDTAPGGSVTLGTTNTLTIGYDGSGSYVYSYPLNGSASGTASITADTIQMSVLSTAGDSDYNYLGTYNTNHSVAAGTLNVGVAGDQGGAENYGGTWTIGNTTIGVESTASLNYVLINHGGTFTNTGAFTVGLAGSENNVSVGYADEFGTPGTLLLTGANDLVIGSGSSANLNSVNVQYDGSSLSVNGNIVVGIDGQTNSFSAANASTVSSVGTRLGVNASSGNNFATITDGASWTMNGTARVGDKGSFNHFNILNGGTVALTGSGKNFYVGYEKSASSNTLTVSGSGSTLQMHDATADLVVSANQGSGGSSSTGNQVDVSNGGLLDVTRVLVGDGGTLSGNDGTIGGNTVIAAGGTLSPGAMGGLPLGSLSFLGNVDLSQSGGGTFAVDLAASGTCDVITVSGTLSIANSTLSVTAGAPDTGAAYVIAHYSSLLGQFATVTGLPGPNWYVDYNYLGLNEIAIVAVPEIDPASLGSGLALLLGSLGLLDRRSRARSRRIRRN